MWKIGNIKISSQVVLAPMAGITSLSYREFMKPFGVGYSVSEMISDAGISYHNEKTLEYLATSKLDRPVALQLFGSDIKRTLKALDIINDELKIDYDILDLNFGCPVHKVTSNGAGSAWLKDSKKLYQYVKSVVEHSPKPVTAKIRLGYDQKHILAFKKNIAVLEKAGVKAIALHARTKEELYSGEPHYDLLKDLQKKMHVPLIISGNIFSLDDAIKALKITKAQAVMVARGALGNPYLITQIDKYLSKKIKLSDISPRENIKYCRKLSRQLIQEKGEKTGVSILRSIAPKFIDGFKGAKTWRNKIAQTIKSQEDLETILTQIEKELKQYGRKESRN
ncbi:MAG: tRNA-dihydrouridine synthase family protein [Bacilli bacterium]|nr:tRNA-dihydrouridine synthase family protein [Bacilli bacterium]